MNNLKSYTEYAVTSETTDFVIGFDFNYGTDAVNITVDGVPASAAGYTVVYLNSTTMRLTPAVTSGVVRLQRETDIDAPDNSFTAGAKFIASNMDENFTQIRHSQQEVRDGFNKLSTDTNEIISTLEDVAQSAQDAANAANSAAQVANDAASQVSDKVDRKEGAALPYKEGIAYEENAVVVKDGILQQWKGGEWVDVLGNLKTYTSLSELVAVKGDIADGTLARVLSHYMPVMGMANFYGGGVYEYDSSVAQFDGGIYVKSDNGGAWVLKDVPKATHFGLRADPTLPQSDVLQAYFNRMLDLDLDMDVGLVDQVILLDKTVVIRPATISEVAGWSNGYTKQVKSLKLRGCTLKSTTNINMLHIMRDSVIIDIIKAEAVGTRSCAVVLGMTDEYTTIYPSSTYKYSTMHVEIKTIYGDNLQTLLKIVSDYSVYYFNIGRIVARDVGFCVSMVSIDATKSEQITRGSINSIVHVGGACTLYVESAESLTVSSIYSEFITQTWWSDLSTLPDSAPVQIYIKAANAKGMHNHTIRLNQVVGEDCSRFVNCFGKRCVINGYWQKWAGQPSNYNLAFQGKYTNGYSDTPSNMLVNASTHIEPEESGSFTIPFSLNSSADTAVRSTYPAGIPTTCIGFIERRYISHSYNQLCVDFLFVQETDMRYKRLVRPTSDWASSIYDPWTLDGGYAVQVDSSKYNQPNSMIETSHSPSVTNYLLDYNSTDSPNGGWSYGTVQYFATSSTRGVQVFTSTLDGQVKRRTYNNGVFSAWV